MTAKRAQIDYMTNNMADKNSTNNTENKVCFVSEQPNVEINMSLSEDLCNNSKIHHCLIAIYCYLIFYLTLVFILFVFHTHLNSLNVGEIIVLSCLSIAFILCFVCLVWYIVGETRRKCQVSDNNIELIKVLLKK